MESFLWSGYSISAIGCSTAAAILPRSGTVVMVQQALPEVMLCAPEPAAKGSKCSIMASASFEVEAR